LVQINAVGVCGSDVHYYQHGRIGDFVVERPMVLGHESGGVVVGVGRGVDNSRIGQRVSVEPGVPDLTCPECLAGRYNLCPDMKFFATPPFDGSLAEFVTVHEAFAHPVPDSMSDDAAALLEPLSVGVWASRKGHVSAGSRVLITGAGPIGLVATQCARAFGATEVVVADLNPHRLKLAKDLGATATLNVAETSLSDAGFEPTVLLECSGHPGATNDALRTLGRAGRAVLVGMGGDELPLPLGYIQSREIEVTGTFRYANTWPTAIALAASGRVDVDALVTGHFTLADSEAALLAGERDPLAVKSVINPHH
jgi:L-iditol 2-dehydrogenase